MDHKEQNAPVTSPVELTEEQLDHVTGGSAEVNNTHNGNSSTRSEHHGPLQVIIHNLTG